MSLGCSSEIFELDRLNNYHHNIAFTMDVENKAIRVARVQCWLDFNTSWVKNKTLVHTVNMGVGDASLQVMKGHCESFQAVSLYWLLLTCIPVVY